MVEESFATQASWLTELTELSDKVATSQSDDEDYERLCSVHDSIREKCLSNKQGKQTEPFDEDACLNYMDEIKASMKKHFERADEED